MNHRSARFDAPFWSLLLVGCFSIGALGFFGLAAAAQDAARGDGMIVSMDQ